MADEDKRSSAERVGFRVDGAGNVVVPASLAAEIGLRRPDELVWERRENSLVLAADRLRKVYVEATSVCNLRCPTCLRNVREQPPVHMTLECFGHLLEGLPDGRPTDITLAFSGFGEPMAHPAFLEMLELARARDLRTEITTNGTFLDAAMARQLVSLGVNQVAASVDPGAETEAAAIRSGPLSAIFDGLLALRDAQHLEHRNVCLGLTCVVRRQNAAGVPALIQLANELKLDFCSISGLVPCTAELEEDVLWRRTASVADCEPSAWSPRLTVAHMDSDAVTAPLVKAVGRQLDVIPPPAFDSRRRRYCRFAGEGMMAVASDGHAAPCLSLLYTHTEHVNGQRRLVHALNVGSAAVRPLAGIWRDPGFREFRQRVRTFAFPPCFTCRPCPLTEANQEDCDGNPFPTCAVCLWAHGIVLCP